MKNIFKHITLFILFACSSIAVQAQGTLDKLKFEEAEQKYLNKDYSGAVTLLEELEQKGLKNPRTLHLKILAVSKLSTLGYDLVIQFKKDVDYYLKNYDIEGLEGKYKEVYEVSKTLSDKKYDEGELCAAQGDTYYKVKLYENALEWYLRAGKSAGYINAKLFDRIGYMHYTGQGVEKDLKKAFEWYEKAADQGHAKAQNFIGWMYQTGQVVESDTKKAIEYYTKAANQGFDVAYTNLASLYYWKEDYKNAFEWYNKVITNAKTKGGKPIGVQNQIAYMYENGQGVERDLNKAFEWYTKSAEQGDEYAQYNLGVIYKNGQGVESDNKKAFEWYTKAAAQGNIDAQTDLGRLYATGEGVEKDLDKAIELFKKAVEGGYKNSFYLAYAYETKGNYTEAYKYYQQNNETGKFGYYFYEGKTINQDYGKAVEYWEISAQKATIYNFPLAVAYFSGKGVQKDTNKAYSLISGVLEKYKDKDILKNYKEDREHSKKHFPNYSKDEDAFFEWLAKEHNIKFE